MGAGFDKKSTAAEIVISGAAGGVVDFLPLVRRRGVQLTGGGPLEDRRESLGGVVDDLGDLEDFLSTSRVCKDA